MTRQLTDRPPAVAEAGNAGPRRPRWSGRTRRDFFVFLALALPNLALIAVFTYLPADQQHLLLHAGLDARFRLRHGRRPRELHHLLHQRRRPERAGHHRRLHPRHGRRVHGPRAAGGPRAELQSPRHHLCPLRRVRALRAERRRRRARVAVHLRPRLRGPGLAAARHRPAEPAVDQRSPAVAGHGDHRLRLEEPRLLRRGATWPASSRCRRTSWKRPPWTAPTASGAS